MFVYKISVDFFSYMSYYKYLNKADVYRRLSGGRDMKLTSYFAVTNEGVNFSPDFSVSSVISVKEKPNTVIFPGFCDVHVHFRQPGFLYKETVKTGSLAAAAGGYTSVCTMPNLSPVPDGIEGLTPQLEAIEKGAVIGVHPYGAITVGQKGIELSDMDAIAPHVIAFSDDGKGVQEREKMKAAMLKAKSLGRMIVAHCEDESLLFGGYIHKGSYAKAHGHRGISSESEYAQLRRDLELVRETGVSYHVCHVSTKESVELIRKAKAEGLDVTAETAPHYLILTEDDLCEDGRFKMNPPLRGAEDREALINGLIDKTIDMIATDHAPHSAEEKSRGLEKSLFGIVGLETAFSLLYTHLVKTGKVSLERIINALTDAPRKRFGIKNEGFTVFDLGEKYKIDPSDFKSLGRATPFEGSEVYGKCILTVYKSKAVYQDKKYMEGSENA